MKKRNKIRNTMILILSIILFILMIYSFFIEDSIKNSQYDTILFKISNLFIMMSTIIPLLLLLNKKIRGQLPMFKKKKWWLNLFGYLLIFVISIGMSEVIDGFHSEEYKIAYQEYLIVEKTGENSKETEKELENKLNNLTNDENNVVIREDLEKNTLTVHYLDVGQGDTTFIELPNNQTMLIDAGESGYAEKIIEYIKKLGYSKIDYVVGTHPHTDHIGGLANVINTFEIGLIYMPKAVSTSKTYEHLLNTILEKNMSVKTAKEGVNILEQESLKISILSPKQNSYTKLNNYSAVIKMVFQNTSFLFMGDAEKEVEQELTDEVKADIIKIGHHGSNTSSSEEFVAKVKPQYAIVSVGKDNKYNHPYEEILNRWKNIGASIYRTDELGTIVATSDGTKIVIDNQEQNSITTTTEAEKSTTSKAQGTEIEQPENSTQIDETQPITKTESTTEIELQSFTESVSKGQNATIKIKGNPNTNYSITVIYSTSPSKAKGLENKMSDENGYVSWTFKVGTNTKPGTYPVTISDGSIKQTFQLKVE